MLSVIRQPAVRSAFTMMEVMVALVILSVALFTVVGQFASVRSTQVATESTEAVERIVQSLVERLNSSTWANLGTSEAPWSWARYENGTGRAPMTEGATNAEDNLVELGLLNRSTAPKDLRVYFEYWRAVSSVDGSGNIIASEPGILDAYDPGAVVVTGLAAEVAEYESRVYINPNQKNLGFKAVYGIWNTASVNSVSPTTLMNERPLLVRIVATWDSGTQRREVLTGRGP